MHNGRILKKWNVKKFRINSGGDKIFKFIMNFKPKIPDVAI